MSEPKIPRYTGDLNKLPTMALVMAVEGVTKIDYSQDNGRTLESRVPTLVALTQTIQEFINPASSRVFKGGMPKKEVEVIRSNFKVAANHEDYMQFYKAFGGKVEVAVAALDALVAYVHENGPSVDDIIKSKTSVAEQKPTTKTDKV